MFIHRTCLLEEKFPISVFVRFTDCFSLGPFDQDLSTSHSTNVIRPVYFSFSLSILIIENVQVMTDPTHKFPTLLTSAA